MSNTFVFANWASTTLANPANSTTTTLTVVAPTNPFPTPTNGSVFVLELIDALTNSIFEICYCTHRAGNVLTVVRGQEGTTAVSWLAGDTAANFLTAGQMGTAVQRIQLAANLNLFVNGSTGNDSNSGLSSGAPFATFNQAWSTLLENYDLNGFNATINQAGTNTDNLAANGFAIGATTINSVTILVQGTWRVINGTCINANNSAFRLGGAGLLTATGTGIGQGYAVAAFGGSQINFQGITFGVCGNSHIAVQQNGAVACSSGYTISGSANSHIAMGFGASAQISGVSVALTGTPNFSTAFADVENCASLNIGAVTFAGSATGSRYIVTKNGSIDTASGGATYLPGNSAGSATAGGQYN